MKVNYRYWVALLLALLVAIAAEAHAEPRSHAEVVQGMYRDDPYTAHAVCAAWNALVAVKSDGFVKDYIGKEARRHGNKVREYYGAATDQIFAELFHTAQTEFNAGRVTWVDLTKFGEACMEIGQ